MSHDEEVKELLAEVAAEHESLSAEMLHEIYDLEQELSTMDRRQGIKEGLRKALTDRYKEQHEA